MTPAIIKRLAAVELPPTVDTAGLCAIIEELEGYKPAEETVRRWPIPYRLIGRVRRYEVDRAIAYLRARFDLAPVRVAARSPRRRVVASAKTGPSP